MRAIIVSIHAPLGGATRDVIQTGGLVGFNPRAPRGRDTANAAEALIRAMVSIHAPLGGATAMSQGFVAVIGVSIHAPLGGATSLKD